jgi:micrococcal nuclease
MKTLIIVMFLFVAVPGASTQPYKVTYITDADTVKVSRDGQQTTVRVLGIDCPESKYNDKCRRDGRQGRPGCAQQVPRGKKANKRARELLEGATVTLECDGRCKDGYYGRALRYIRLADGRDYGLVMVKAGLCEDYGWKYPHPRGGEYRSAN